MWRACERLHLIPPDVEKEFDDNDVYTKAEIIAYSQIREYEEAQQQLNLYRALGAKV